MVEYKKSVVIHDNAAWEVQAVGQWVMDMI